MRVIAGSAGGLTLVAPRDRSTRPITDRVKETLFAILGDRVVGASVADLYAGSGAIGIEALSRGAEHAVFVEQGRAALDVIRQNLRKTRLDGSATVIGTDVIRYLDAGSAGPFDLAFLDPPYEARDILAPLQRLRPHLRAGAAVVVKHFWRSVVPDVEGLAAWRERRFGETSLTFLEAVNEA